MYATVSSSTEEVYCYYCVRYTYTVCLHMYSNNILDGSYPVHFANAMHESLEKFGKKVSLGVCFNKKNGWHHEQWTGPDYQDAGKDSKENYSDDKMLQIY